MREVSDCRLTDVSQHIDNTVSGQPCLEPCWVFMPGYLWHASHYIFILFPLCNKCLRIRLSVTNVKGFLRAGGSKVPAAILSSSKRESRQWLCSQTAQKPKTLASHWYAFPDGRESERAGFLWTKMVLFNHLRAEATPTTQREHPPWERQRENTHVAQP